MEESNYPLYDHDCLDCIFLGRYPDREGTDEDTYDLYIHDRGIRRTDLIARFSSYGPDYFSSTIGDFFRRSEPSNIDKIYFEILKRAKEFKVSIR